MTESPASPYYQTLTTGAPNAISLFDNLKPGSYPGLSQITEGNQQHPQEAGIHTRLPDKTILLRSETVQTLFALST